MRKPPLMPQLSEYIAFGVEITSIHLNTHRVIQMRPANSLKDLPGNLGCP